MQCPRCFTNQPDGVNFCSHCGALLAPPSGASPIAAPVAALPFAAPVVPQYSLGGSIVGTIAAVMIVAGSLLPWVTMGMFSAAGTEGDGNLTIIAGVIGGVGALDGFVAKRPRVAANILMLLAGLGAFYVAASAIQRLATAIVEETEFTAHIGGGLYLCALASLLLFLGGIVGFSTMKPK